MQDKVPPAITKNICAGKPIQDGIMGALQQLLQPNKRVADILTWIRYFMLYIAVMAAKCHDLVGPMISHRHTVMHLQATYIWSHVLQ